MSKLWRRCRLFLTTDKESLVRLARTCARNILSSLLRSPIDWWRLIKNVATIAVIGAAYKKARAHLEKKLPPQIPRPTHREMRWYKDKNLRCRWVVKMSDPKN